MVTVHNKETNANWTIAEMNREMTSDAMPGLIFIGIISLIGIIGNGIVMLVYGTRRYPKCNFKYFVLILAGIDSVSCVILMPLEMFTLVHWFIYPEEWICKFKSFLNAYTVSASADCLLLIAIDRYRKVCWPHKKQIQPNLAMKLTSVILSLALIPAISDAVFWGLHTYAVNSADNNATATICEKDDKFKDTIWPQLHTMVLYSGTNIIVMLATMVLYVLIAVKLFCGFSAPGLITPEIVVSADVSCEMDDSGNTGVIFKYPTDIESGISESEECDKLSSAEVSDQSLDTKGVDKSLNKLQTEENTSISTCQSEAKIPLRTRTKSLDFDEISKRKQDDRNSLDIKQSSTRLTLNIPEVTRRFPSHARSAGTKPNTDTKFIRRRVTVASLSGRAGIKLRRKTLIMFILTAIFVGTTLLYLSLISYMSDNSNIMATLGHSETVAWLFFLRLYFVNSVINPFLYGFLDPRFKKAIWNMGFKISWFAGSLKKNFEMSIRRSTSGRTRDKIIYHNRQMSNQKSSITSE